MRRDTLVFALAGIVFGFVVGYMAASWDVIPRPVAGGAPAGAQQDRFVECRFAAGGHASPERESLVGVTTEAGPLGEVRLHMLKRFWLEREGAAADPEPIANASPGTPKSQ